MNTQQLIDALKEGKSIMYLDNAEQPDQFVTIEPYKSDFETKAGMGFHFYGWGSAYWKNDNVFKYICLFPENFEIVDMAMEPGELLFIQDGKAIKAGELK